jgi:hypothetical protein
LPAGEAEFPDRNHPLMTGPESLQSRAARYRLKASECRSLAATSSLPNVMESYAVLAASYDTLASEAVALHFSRIAILATEPQAQAGPPPPPSYRLGGPWRPM